MSNEYLNNLFGLEGQTAVVIGGTGVLGGAIAEGLASAGAYVVVSGRSEDKGYARVDVIRGSGGEAGFLPVDVYSRDSMNTLLEKTLGDRGQVDILVNCAGVNSPTPFGEITDEEFRRIMDGNLTATFLGCQVFAPQMVKQEDGGSILNIGSVTAHLPLSRVFTYSASKAAVVNLTKNLAREYATQGVRVNSLCPGFFPAEQNREILKTGGREEKILSQTPMARYGEPHELVGAVLLMVSRNAGSFVTGTEIYVDGGFTGMRF